MHFAKTDAMFRSNKWWEAPFHFSSPVSRVSLSLSPSTDHTALQGQVSRVKGKTGRTICFGLSWFHNRPLCCQASPGSCDAASLLSINTLFAPDLDELCKTQIPRWLTRKTRARPSLKLSSSRCLFLFVFLVSTGQIVYRTSRSMLRIIWHKLPLRAHVFSPQCWQGFFFNTYCTILLIKKLLKFSFKQDTQSDTLVTIFELSI